MTAAAQGVVRGPHSPAAIPHDVTAPAQPIDHVGWPPLGLQRYQPRDLNTAGCPADDRAGTSPFTPATSALSRSYPLARTWRESSDPTRPDPTRPDPADWPDGRVHVAKIAFLGWEGALPTGVALLFAAIAGVLLVAVPGGVRIAQLRRTRRETRTDHEAERHP
jgi:hypothetical protein